MKVSQPLKDYLDDKKLRQNYWIADFTNLEPYSKPHIIEKKNSPRAVS